MHRLKKGGERVTALAYVFAVLKNVIYGTTPFFTGALTESVDVLDVLALRFLLSFAVFFLLKVTRIVKINVSVKDFFVKNPRSGAMKSILLTALFEPVLYMLFETLGVSMSSDITVGVILSLSAVTSCIFEVIFLGETSTFWQKVFLGLGIFGAIYIAVNSSTAGGKDSVLGIVFLLLAVTSGSLFCVFSRKSSSAFSSMEVTYVSCLLGAVAFNAVNVVRHLARGDILHYFDPYFSWSNLLGFAVLAILSTIVATCMNNFALGRMQSSTMAAFGGISTFVTIAVGVFFGGEKLMTYHYIGLTCIVARMVGVSYIAIKRDKARSLAVAKKE